MHDHDRARRARRDVEQGAPAAATPGRRTLIQRTGAAVAAARPKPAAEPIIEAVASREQEPHHQRADHRDRDRDRDRGDDDDDDDDDRDDRDGGGGGGKHHGGPAKAKHASGGNEIHIITRAGLRHLRQDGREGRHAARVLYNNPNAYVVLKEGQTLPRRWKAKATILFPSYTEFEAAANAGRIPKWVDAVVYDNEHWDQTPGYEKTHAIRYAKAFGELAHRLGLVYIAAPTRKWFAADARFADIIDVQLQSREVHTKSYERALRHDVKLAHRLNPDIKVVAQISSNRNHLDPDHSGNIGAGIRKAERDIVKNAPYIDGFWGYLYQQNKKSIRAGVEILEDLAEKREKGVKI